jgi:hypothetical protein
MKSRRESEAENTEWEELSDCMKEFLSYIDGFVASNENNRGFSNPEERFGIRHFDFNPYLGSTLFPTMILRRQQM